MNLIAERVNRGLSTLEASKAMGVSRGALESAETGKCPRSPSVAKRIADFYGVLVTDLWPVQSWATVNWGIDGPRNDTPEPEPSR